MTHLQPVVLSLQQQASNSTVGRTHTQTVTCAEMHIAAFVQEQCQDFFYSPLNMIMGDAQSKTKG
jgi:hypothetical protein